MNALPSPPPKSPAPPRAGEEYLCVCGRVFPLPPDGQATACPACGRRYTHEALLAAAAATLSLQMDAAAAAAPLPRPAEADDDDPLIGQRLDHFRIVRLLGCGGMGAVYLAVDESLERYVALKVMSGAADGSDGSQRVDRLVHEARAQARVSHPHVVHIYYVGRDESAPFFAMELISGPTLAARLADGPLPVVELIDIALQITAALERASDFGIVHGDVKPGNILLAGPSLAKLSDFGLAQRTRGSDPRTPRIVGTPDYLSPEAARGEPLTSASDMYSLGVTLFEAALGKLPYGAQGSSVLEKLESHKSSPVEFPEIWPAGVPEAFRDVLARLLAKRPEDRFASYADLRAALLAVRPVQQPAAAKAPRALAWLIDLMLVFGLRGIVFGTLENTLRSAEASGVVPVIALAHLLIALAAISAPGAAATLQSWWKTTPGKRLFQLRIVTMHGLAPSPGLLALRSVAQFLPVWLVVVGEVFRALHLEGVGALFGLFFLPVMLVDVGLALFHPAGRSLHDLALGTRVALDARSHATPSVETQGDNDGH